MIDYNKDKFIKFFSRFTNIKEDKLRDYLQNRSIRTLLEHPNSLDITPNQLEKVKKLMKLSNIYSKLESMKDLDCRKADDLVVYLKSHFPNLYEKEHMVVAFLDSDFKALGAEVISTGTLNSSIVHPRDVFREALKYNSKNIVLSHNHPSGNPKPSKEDEGVTRRVMNAGRHLDINLMDHIVIGRDQYFSFRESGFIPPIDLNKVAENKLDYSNTKEYKNDLKEKLDLINKFTKIPKTKLKPILKNGLDQSIKNLDDFALTEEQAEKLTEIHSIINENTKESTQNLYKIKDPESVMNYYKDKYGDMGDIKTAIFLNTKNQVIDSCIVSEKLSENKEKEFILKNAINFDSSAIIIGAKEPYKINIDKEAPSYARDLSDACSDIGIRLLDYVNIDKDDRYISLKELEVLENSENYNVNKQLNNKENKKTIQRKFVSDLMGMAKSKGIESKQVDIKKRDLSLEI